MSSRHCETQTYLKPWQHPNVAIESTKNGKVPTFDLHMILHTIHNNNYFHKKIKFTSIYLLHSSDVYHTCKNVFKLPNYVYWRWCVPVRYFAFDWLKNTNEISSRQTNFPLCDFSCDHSVLVFKKYNFTFFVRQACIKIQTNTGNNTKNCIKKRASTHIQFGGRNLDCTVFTLMQIKLTRVQMLLTTQI